MAHFMEESSAFDAVSAFLNRSIQSCRLQFFSTEQAQSVSVVRITRSDAFDELGRATTDGLHDCRMGVTQMNGQAKICPTCQMTAAQGCPGHLGHIQLHTEVYNPFLLPQLVKLLQLVCVHCGKFRCGDATSARFVRIFSCLARGQTPPDLHDALLCTSRHALDQDVSNGWSDGESQEPLSMLWEDHVSGTRRRVRMPPRSRDEHIDAAQTLQKSLVKEAKRKRREWRSTLDYIVDTFPIMSECGESVPSFILEQWRLAVKQFIAQSRESKVCKMCGERLVKFRKEGNSRIYQQDDKNARYFCTPTRIREYIRKIFAAEPVLMSFLYPGSREAEDQLFFVETILVTPNCFRPLAGAPGSLVLAMETRNLIRIMETNDKLAESLKEGEDPHDGVALSYVQLQEAVNCYYDSSKGATKTEKLQKGVRQVLERKEGLFRSKMMGKRVNFAARSVISPDNNLEGYEIGLPPHIVKTLAYPEPVTMYNVARMRKLVENGMDVYPGASYVLQLSASGENRCIDLTFMSKQKRQALAQKLLVGLESGEPPFVVYRNLVNGDPVLMNRQPTLHKPGMMAHKVRVLHGEKTIRMHYVNCNTYNADFDGDEMNCHAPQDPISRIEALSIAFTDDQYLVPTSGKPLRGLIQDHVVGGVFLSARDTFLTQEQAAHLLYKGLFGIMEGDAKHMVEIGDGVHRPRTNPKQQFRFCWEEPCLMKPKRWSGKQILSMVLKSLLRAHGWQDSKLFHVSTSKTPGDIWNGALDGNKEEARIVIRSTELLCGVLDKSQFGAAENGLVHLCYEIFGPAMASRTLSVFAKLFTAYLQMTGFTCAMSDFLVNRASDGVRAKLIEETHIAGAAVIDQFSKDHDSADGDDLAWKLKKILAANPRKVDLLDGKMLGKLREFWGQTIDACLPSGQVVPFPKNCFATMIQTGAKGSKTNHSQISCLMGQQELEGRRVPFLPTRRSLPSFAPFDYGPRAGGYVTDRFLTGFRPQEFFFHCMAGREGLVDTAVKTSRSGYLQRCLIKHLESLVVAYDYTVRDISDGSVVQFLYGEDGCEVVKTSHLTQFDVAQQNPSRSEEALNTLQNCNLVDMTLAQQYHELLTYAVHRLGQKDRRRKVILKLKELRDLCGSKNYPQVERHVDFVREHLKVCIDGDADRWKHAVERFLEPACSIFAPGLFFGATSEKYNNALKDYLSTASMSGEEKKAFQDRMHFQFQRSLCEAGEAVGVVAAQGMGEPSTQMTLNTFHLAGHGANVTLGIPRLREIVQTASKKIMTPTMKVLFRQTPTGATDLEKVHAYASTVAQRYSRSLLKDLVREKRVTETLRDDAKGRKRTYAIVLEFEDFEEIGKRLPYITREVMEETMCIGGGSFKHRLSREVTKLIAIAKAGSESGIQKGVSQAANEEVSNVKSEAVDKPEAEKEEQDDVAPPPAKKRKVEKGAKSKRRAGVGSDIESESSEEDVTDGESGEEKEEKEEDESMGVQTDDEDMEEGGFVRASALNGNTFVTKVVVSVTQSPAKMLLSEVVSLLLDSIYVQDPTAEGLNSLHVVEDKKKIYIETEGINMHAFWCLPDECICTESIYTNCIGSMMAFYGVESCRRSIVAEIRNVFGHYGIEVNYRHLYLVADYMTHTGGYRACNRIGMQDAASPFLQMTYESSMAFCTTAAVEGLVDSLTAPAGSIMIGNAPHLGSNSFSVHSDLSQKQATGSNKVFTFS